MAINVNKYVEEANEFIKQVAEELGDGQHIEQATRIIVTVLHTLRERITVEESMHLISQLPMVLKGVYVDGWDITAEMSRADTLEEFIDELRMHSDRTAGVDFGDDRQATDNARAVLKVMGKYVSPGEMEHIKGQLPKEVAELLET
jgi:uncharacterized protein (DUF2267 family)